MTRYLKYILCVWISLMTILACCPASSQNEVDFYLSSDGYMYVKLFLDGESEGQYFLFDINGINFIRDDQHDFLDLYQISDKKKSFQFLDIQFGGLEWKRCDFVLRSAIDEIGHTILPDSVIGCVGYYFMKKHCWQINYQTKKITFAKSCESLDIAKTAIHIPFTQTIINRSINIDLSLNHQKSRTYTVSTAYPLSISTPLSNIKQTDKQVRKTGHKSFAFFGLMQNLTVTNFIIQNVTLDNVATISNVSTQASDKLGYMIGNDFLKHFITTIDWEKRMLYLEARDEYQHHVTMHD